MILVGERMSSVTLLYVTFLSSLSFPPGAPFFPARFSLLASLCFLLDKNKTALGTDSACLVLAL